MIDFKLIRRQHSSWRRLFLVIVLALTFWGIHGEDMGRLTALSNTYKCFYAVKKLLKCEIIINTTPITNV